MGIDFNKLKEQMPFKWRVQATTKFSANCVAYVDARQVQDKLDEVVGPMNWKNEYQIIDGDLFCNISIWDDVKEQWITKSDTGTESNVEKQKGQASDAFKRAAVHFGIGRFLYSMEIQKLKVADLNGKTVPVDENGKQIWDVTKYINDRLGKTGSKPVAPKAEVKPVAKPVVKPVENIVTTVAPVEKADGHVPTPGRYDASKGGANVEYNKTVSLSTSTMERVRGLNRDGLTGSEVLKSYLPKYNASHSTSLVAKDLKTDELVISLLDFIDNSAPQI